MRVTSYIKRGLVKKQEEDEWIVRGLRQGGHLAWRPSLEQGRLVNPDEQEWAKKYPLGTGGKLGEYWLDERREWLDEEGKPVPPDWTQQSKLVDAAYEKEG